MKTPHNKHPWTRFWIPFDSDVALDSDDFPSDPDGEYAHYYSLDAQQLSNFQSIPVLILLGEPGIGKSTALEDECERLKNAGGSVFFRKLNSYDTDIALIDDIFRNPQVQEWRSNPETRLILLLDSLDECRLSIPRAARIIAQQLESLPRERLQLRITCRVADWPEEMSADLERLWPSPQGSESPNVKRLSLMPLRRKDVVMAANDRKLDASAFLAEIFRVNIQSFASHPHTLNMLLDIFQKRSCLPPRRAEIFEQGCLHLVTENSRSRKSDGHVGELEPFLRLRLAGRIAAQMLLSQKSVIFREDADQPENSLAISEILGGEEESDGLKLSVNSRAVREVLDTTLFTGRGEQRLGFVHQSNMDFLSAWYLKKRGLDAKRLLSLLRFAEDGHIPPQLGELAAWLAEMDGALFDALANSDPLVLLRSDGSALTDMQKSRLVERLLDAITRHEASDWGWNLRKHYPKLAHPELAAQLKPLLLDQNHSAPVREAAIGIAAACRLSELGSSLIDMALASQESQRIRHEAAKAAIETADKVSLGKLHPLLVGENEDVSFRSLLARALWPEHISTQEIFGFIAQSKNLGILGTDRYQLENWVKLFSPGDMWVALGWIKETEPSSAHYDFQKLMDVLMVHAWKMFQSEPSIGETFAQAVWACLQRSESLFNRLGKAEPITHLVHSSQHQRLLELLFVEVLASSDENAYYVFSGRIRDALLDDSCVPWLLTKYRDAHHPSERKLIACCIGGCLSFQSSPTLLDEAIGAACDDAPQAESPLADEISFLVKPYWLDNKITQDFREGYINQQKGKQGLNPPPAQRVENALREFESGKLDVWMRLWRELGLNLYSWNLKEICDMPGWNRLDMHGKKRVQQCAIGWLNSQRLTDADLFLENRYSDKHICSCLALDLLMRQDQVVLEKFPVERWQEWTPAIVRYPRTKARASLLRLAYALAPKSTLATFRRECEREMAGDGPLSLHDLKTLWDANIAALLHELLTHDELKPQHRQELLESLMAQGDHAALDTAFGLFAVASGEETLSFANLLLNHAAAEAWPILWKKMGEDTTFAREFMLGVAFRSHSFAFLNELNELQLAKLYVLLETHFPQAEDIQHPEGVYSPTSRDDVANLRGNSITQLAGRGTQAAIMELQTICGQFPNHDWLWHQLAQAREKMRQLAWQPIPPHELLDFLQRADTRLVRNATELAEAVIASLSRLQAKFKGESPLAPFLWNMDEENEKRGRPKGEDRMSDFVLHHLRADLPMLVINREVQVQNLNESGVPERADLKVETLDAEGNPLTLIVESKGCWNAKLHMEMATQLHDRYMKKTHAGAGIYLVGWFACERWKDEKKKTACQKQVSLEHLRELLSRQAGKLAGVRVFVLDATY